MAAMLSFLLVAVVVAVTCSPVPEGKEDATTVASADSSSSSSDYVWETVYEVIGLVPVDVDDAVLTTTEVAEEHKHKIAKRSTLRGDNSNNDLLAAADALKYDGGESSLIGHKFKFLPSWAG